MKSTHIAALISAAALVLSIYGQSAHARNAAVIAAAIACYYLATSAFAVFHVLRNTFSRQIPQIVWVISALDVAALSISLRVVVG